MDQLLEGKKLFEEQDYQKAIDVLSNFLKKYSSNADALYMRAVSYRKTGNFDRSIEDLTLILHRLPDEASLLSERGVSYFHKKDFDNALKDMDRAVDLEPNNPYRYSSRAYIRANVDVKGAASDYEKAIELDPEDEISHNNLGLLYENKGKVNTAKKHFNKANKILGYDPEKKDANKEETNQQIENSESISQIMFSVFKSKKARKEYFSFLKSFFSRK